MLNGKDSDIVEQLRLLHQGLDEWDTDGKTCLEAAELCGRLDKRIGELELALDQSRSAHLDQLRSARELEQLLRTVRDRLLGPDGGRLELDRLPRAVQRLVDARDSLEEEVRAGRAVAQARPKAGSSELRDARARLRRARAVVDNLGVLS